MNVGMENGINLPDKLITIMILWYVRVIITISMHYIVWCVTVTVLQNNGSVIGVEFEHFSYLI